MTVSSGIRPYAYTRYPFILNDDERIGYSGILFEEAMFAITAERDAIIGITGTDRWFYKYLSNNLGSSGKIAFEPTPTGGHLDGTAEPIAEEADNPFASYVGAVNFSDYIEGMRSGLESLWSEMDNNDSDYTAAEIKEAHFSGIGLSGTWVHTPEEINQQAQLYDIDLREVQWQPLLRFAKYADLSLTWQTPASPIIPGFQNEAGSLISVSSRDLEQSKNLNPLIASGYTSAATNKFLFSGDGFTSTTKAYYFDMWTDKKGGGTIEVSDIGYRTLNHPLQGALAEATPSTAPSGIKRLFLFDSNPNAIPSSLMSYWPKRISGMLDNYSPNTNTYIDAENEVLRISGVQVFNNYFANTSVSGESIVSPFNGETLWTRFGDMTEWTINGENFSTTGDWRTKTPYGYDGENLIYYAIDADGPSETLLYAHQGFTVQYDMDTLDLIGTNLSLVMDKSDVLVPQVNMPDITTHNPASGTNIANYTLMPCREASDDVGTSVIWDGSNFRGTLGASLPANISPNPLGVCDGEIYGKKENNFGPRYWKMQVEPRPDNPFPQPISSGLAPAGLFKMTTESIIVYSENIQHDFFQIEDVPEGSVEFSCNSPLIQPTGDLDIGDNSALIRFTAKPSGATTSKTYLGRIIPVVSGGQKQLEIIEYWGPMDKIAYYVNSV
jgi:hypothetical protein